MAILQKEQVNGVRWRAWRVYLFLLPFLPSFVGCSAFPRFFTKAPSAQIAAGSTQLTQTGAAQIPAAASVDTTSIEIPLSAFVTNQEATAPAWSQPGRSQNVTLRGVSAPGSVTGAGSQTVTARPHADLDDSQTVTARSLANAGGSLRITTRRETATGPQSFAPPEPPKPPTAKEQASADLIRWSGLGALGLALLAGLLAWAQHYLAALKVGAAAVALPLLANFFGSTVAMVVTGILLALGAGLWLAWGILKRKVSSGQNPFTAS